MWQRLPAFIREWSILIVGILLIVPFLYLSSYEASSSKSTASAPTLSQNDERRRPANGSGRVRSKRAAKFTSRTNPDENRAGFCASARQSTGDVA